MRIHAKHNRQYPDMHIGYTVKYIPKQLCDKGHVSRWTNETYIVEGISRSNGLVFVYKTSARDIPFLSMTYLNMVVL